ncbi:MAG: LamG-like jellyroll fold domain-containing protein, partial [Actinomycetota bacterium]
MLRTRTTYRRRTGLRLLVGPVLALVAVAGLPFAPLGPVRSAVAADYRSTVLEDSPKSYWRLGAGGAGHDQTGLLQLNSSATAGHAGAIGGDPDTAVYLNGDWASLNRTSLGSPNPLGFGHFSLEAWFRVDPGWQGEGYLVHVGPGWYRLGVKERRLTARAQVAGGSATVTSSAYVADSEWHHAVLTGDGARLRLYLDSVEVGNVAMAGPATGSGSSNVSLGVSLGSGGTHFKGHLDEAAVYDAPLSPERIAAHYVASGRQPRLVGGPMADHERRGACNSASGQAAASFGQATHFPVNTATGNFWHTFTDLTIPGRGVPLRLQRTYNSDLAAVDGPFGKGLVQHLRHGPVGLARPGHLHPGERLRGGVHRGRGGLRRAPQGAGHPVQGARRQLHGGAQRHRDLPLRPRRGPGRPQGPPRPDDLGLPPRRVDDGGHR